jgi:hypothetical protein
MQVTLATATPGATIYYTTNGVTPSTSTAKYLGPIIVHVTTTIKAIAVAPNMANSAVASGLYTIGSSSTAATPTFSPNPGSYSTAQQVAISSTTSGATIYYTTDGSTPTAASAKYSAPIPISTTTTLKAIATATGLANSGVATGIYTFGSSGGSTAATPTFSPAPGTYPSSMQVTLASATPGATIYYTTNGVTPSTSTAKYLGPIIVHVTTTIKAIAVAPNMANSAVASGVYTIGSTSTTAATPTFSPAPGTYTGSMQVTLSTATSGATIYYTTNGVTPSTSTAKYLGPIIVHATETIKAIAVAPNMANSSVASGTYTIQ